MNRRELFSFLSCTPKTGQGSGFSNLRMPYYEDVDRFAECKKCESKDCAALCQEKIILISKDGLPYLDFSKSGCTYCDECAIGCTGNVLNVKFKKKIQANITISESKCLSWNATMCFSCKDPCLEDAIEFKAMFMPKIDLQKCTSCGFCISRCPSDAINLEVT